MSPLIGRRWSTLSPEERAGLPVGTVLQVRHPPDGHDNSQWHIGFKCPSEFQPSPDAMIVCLPTPEAAPEIQGGGDCDEPSGYRAAPWDDDCNGDTAPTRADDRVAEIERRLREATPGPWRYNPAACYMPGRNGAEPVTGPQEAVFSDTPNGAPTIALTGPMDDPQSMADAALIAHAPEDLRYLLDLVTTLRGPR